MQTAFTKNCVKGFLVSVGVGAVLLFLFGWICFSREDPEPLIGILGRAALYVSALSGGFFSARVNREKGLVCGLATGGALMLTVMMMSLFMRGNEPMGLLVWIMFLLILPVSAVGGYFGVPQKRRRKKHPRKRR